MEEYTPTCLTPEELSDYRRWQVHYGYRSSPDSFGLRLHDLPPPGQSEVWDAFLGPPLTTTTMNGRRVPGVGNDELPEAYRNKRLDGESSPPRNPYVAPNIFLPTEHMPPLRVVDRTQTEAAKKTKQAQRRQRRRR